MRKTRIEGDFPKEAVRIRKIARIAVELGPRPAPLQDPPSARCHLTEQRVDRLGRPHIVSQRESWETLRIPSAWIRQPGVRSKVGARKQRQISAAQLEESNRRRRLELGQTQDPGVKGDRGFKSDTPRVTKLNRGSILLPSTSAARC
jgi:hypothetical protein